MWRLKTDSSTPAILWLIVRVAIVVSRFNDFITDRLLEGAQAALGEEGLAAGIDPERSIVFVQSAVPEHAELYLLLSMVVPVPWLERVPTYKEQQENLSDRDLSSIGFLGYPLLQTADVVIYDARFVPVGDDQVAGVGDAESRGRGERMPGIRVAVEELDAPGRAADDGVVDSAPHRDGPGVAELLERRVNKWMGTK